jgi:hypothetical protein
MKQITPEEMRDLVMKTFRKRRDTGLRNALGNALMEPANPFQPGEKRRVSRNAGVLLLLAAFMIVAFVYFSFLV